MDLRLLAGIHFFLDFFNKLIILNLDNENHFHDESKNKRNNGGE